MPSPGRATATARARTAAKSRAFINKNELISGNNDIKVLKCDIYLGWKKSTNFFCDETSWKNLFVINMRQQIVQDNIRLN